MSPNLRFLVAEDHAFQRSMLVHELERLGAAAVHSAVDGEAALLILDDPASPVDILITDLDMPGMDGMEFLRTLGNSGALVSIILVSAVERRLLDSVGTMARAYGIKLLGIVEKPIASEELLKLIALHKPPPVWIAHRAARKFSLEEILDGLKRDEFEPFFQPKISIATGLPIGAEALARWRHPRLGIVGPRAFVATLEAAGQIEELTWVILRKAAKFCGRWRATGADVTVAVNLSLPSLSEVTFCDQVTQIVRSQNVEPAHMILELTESALATDLGPALESLARLRMKGFGLSIDDYGTGYSSMQQLNRIAFTELKVEQSFVRSAGTELAARAILESSIELARRLRISSVAEGVETQADFDLLKHLDCDIAQGYFFARPMYGRALLDWARAWKPMI